MADDATLKIVLSDETPRETATRPFGSASNATAPTPSISTGKTPPPLDPGKAIPPPPLPSPEKATAPPPRISSLDSVTTGFHQTSIKDFFVGLDDKPSETKQRIDEFTVYAKTVKEVEDEIIARTDKLKEKTNELNTAKLRLKKFMPPGEKIQIQESIDYILEPQAKRAKAEVTGLEEIRRRKLQQEKETERQAYQEEKERAKAEKLSEKPPEQEPDRLKGAADKLGDFLEDPEGFFEQSYKKFKQVAYEKASEALFKTLSSSVSRVTDRFKGQPAKAAEKERDEDHTTLRTAVEAARRISSAEAPPPESGGGGGGMRGGGGGIRGGSAAAEAGAAAGGARAAAGGARAGALAAGGGGAAGTTAAAGGAAAALGPVGVAVAAVGVAAAAFVVTTAAVYGAARALDHLTHGFQEAARTLSDYNATIAGAVVKSEVRGVLREMRHGKETEEEYADFTGAMDDLRDSMEHVQVFMEKLILPVLTLLARILSKILDLLSPILTVLEKIGSGIKAGGEWVWDKVTKPGLFSSWFQKAFPGTWATFILLDKWLNNQNNKYDDPGTDPREIFEALNPHKHPERFAKEQNPPAEGRGGPARGRGVF